MNHTVTSAIRNRTVLRLEYNGYFRLVEPHAYGATVEGHEVMRCYQTSGGSKSNEPQGWKLLRLDETHMISEAGTTFGQARHGYKRDDKAMSQIYAQL